MMHIRIQSVIFWLFAALALAGCNKETGYPGVGTGLPPCHAEGLASALDQVCQGFEGSLEHPFQVVTLTLGGQGCFGMELDGYGRPTVAHWTAEGGPELAEINPFVSTEVPSEYRQDGAPVAFLAGSRPTASVVVCADEALSGDWTVVGRGRADFETGEVSLTFSGQATAQGRQLTALELTADAALPRTIDMADLSLSWTVAPSDGGDPRPAGETSSRLYLLRRRPLEHLPLLHTPVHLSCEAAAGLSDQQEIIDAVWDSFASLEVNRARDGLPLEYYGSLRRAPGWLRGLLIAGAGQCTTWSHLMHTTLGVQGIDSEVTGVFPCAGRGRIFVGDWQVLDGPRYVSTGADGICDTEAEGDDEQAVEVGQGRPFTEAVTADEPSAGEIEGDDRSRQGRLGASDNGLVDTPVANHGGRLAPVIPLGFGLPQQRSYYILGDPYQVVLGGDDIVRRHIDSWFVLTGPNGINETLPQDLMEDTGPGVYPIPVGDGDTSSYFSIAMPIYRLAIPEDGPFPAGDDRMHDGAWIDSGPDGIADTDAQSPDEQVIPLGQGLPDVPCIGPGPDGQLDSVPAGDDQLLDISEILAFAEEGFLYVKGTSLWPVAYSRGQSTDGPPPDYPNHVILRIGDLFYDPSYGTGPFQEFSDWEDASLVACGQIVVDEEGSWMGIAATIEGELSAGTRMLLPD
jgi:hypothetical protein